MSTNQTPPPPDPPNMAPDGKWGVAPSSSPQMTRAPGNRNRNPMVWVLAALVVVIAIVLIIVLT